MQKLSEEELIKIQRKLSKLLALSASSNEAEAALAIEKCNELMQKYGVNSIDIDPITLQVSTDHRFVQSSGRRMPKWVGYLAYGICQLFDCLVISRTDTGKWEGFTFVGGKSDVVIASDLFIRLKRIVGKMGSIFMENAVHKLNAKSRETYCFGVVSTVVKRLNKIRLGDISSALVLVKKEEIKKHADELFKGGLKKATIEMNISDKTDTTALSKGLIDGHTVPLATAIDKSKHENTIDKGYLD